MVPRPLARRYRGHCGGHCGGPRGLRRRVDQADRWRHDAATTTTAGVRAGRGRGARRAQVTLPPGGIGAEKSDTAVQNILNTSITALVNTPGEGRIDVVTAPTGCQYMVFTQPGAGAAADTGYVGTAFRAILGANCPDPSFRQSLTLSSTSVTGEVTDLDNNPDEINVPGGSITATRPTSRQLEGSFVWKARYSMDIATYRVNFQATIVVPP